MRNRGTTAVIALIQAVIGYEWVKAGWEKVSDPNFVPGLGKTLGVFASKNPTTWYKDFLTGVGIPNASTLGWLVAYGEFVIGITLLVTAAVYLVYGVQSDPISRWVVPIGALVALLGGTFLNANFWFAAGWLSVSTDSVNSVMFLAQLVLASITTYFLTEAIPDDEEEYEWDKFFPPMPRERSASKEPVGITR